MRTLIALALLALPLVGLGQTESNVPTEAVPNVGIESNYDNHAKVKIVVLPKLNLRKPTVTLHLEAIDTLINGKSYIRPLCIIKDGEAIVAFLYYQHPNLFCSAGNIAQNDIQVVHVYPSTRPEMPTTAALQGRVSWSLKLTPKVYSIVTFNDKKTLNFGLLNVVASGGMAMNSVSGAQLLPTEQIPFR